MISYENRVRQLEDEGCTTSDAQSVADVEVMDNKIEPSLATRKFYQDIFVGMSASERLQWMERNPKGYAALYGRNAVKVPYDR
jgi:hypothetical protein